MIKANELRIGNWVSNGEIEFQITSKDIYHRDVRVYGTFIKGLPITPEWLERFGFENKGYIYVLGKFTYNIHNGWWYGNKKLPNVNLQYVHQLQNLYHALTGEELELISNTNVT